MKSAASKSNEIRITRVYDAPVKAVWEAWTDPAQAAKWWGPRGFTITTHSKDLRPGGVWAYTMHGPDGTDYPNRTTYLEIEKHKKLVYDHGANDDRPAMFRVTVLFSEARGKTTMEMTMALATPEAAEETRKFIRKAGGNSTWDRLAEYLEETTHGKEKFVIARSFDAPVGVMFEMWTKPEHFTKWLPPTGMEMRFISVDVREGGSGFYEMGGGNVKMWGRVNYEKIQAPRGEEPGVLVYTQQFCDEKGNVGRHPGMPEFPSTMRTRVEMTAEGPDATRVTVTWEPVDASAVEVAAFVKIRGGMTQGWTGSFDKLEALVGSAEG